MADCQIEEFDDEMFFYYQTLLEEFSNASNEMSIDHDPTDEKSSNLKNYAFNLRNGQKHPNLNFQTILGPKMVWNFTNVERSAKLLGQRTIFNFKTKKMVYTLNTNDDGSLTNPRRVPCDSPDTPIRTVRYFHGTRPGQELRQYYGDGLFNHFVPAFFCASITRVLHSHQIYTRSALSS